MSYGKQNNKELIVRYAKALFALGKEKNQLEVLEKDVLVIRSLLAASKELGVLIKSPLLSRSAQEQAVQTVLSKSAISAVVEYCCRILARNRRLELLDGVMEEVQNLLSQYRNEVTVEAITAVALHEDQRRALVETLSTILHKKIKLQTKVDPSILGGIIVKVGSKMLDGALSSQLKKVRVISKKAVSTLL